MVVEVLPLPLPVVMGGVCMFSEWPALCFPLTHWGVLNVNGVFEFTLSAPLYCPHSVLLPSLHYFSSYKLSTFTVIFIYFIYYQTNCFCFSKCLSVRGGGHEIETSQASEFQTHRRLNEVEGSDRSEFRDIRVNEVNPNITPTTTCGLNMVATREVGLSFMYTTVKY